MNDFGRFEGSEFAPMYGGVDWKQRQEALIESGELEPYQQVGFDSDDGLITESHQENLTIRLNRVAPHMDMIAQKDERDGLDFIWFREANAKRFNRLVKELSRAALVITTEYPLRDTVDIYLDRAETGLDPSFLEDLE
jgi:hypothetical protein